ncbi:hypothetical protein EVA_20376 [gut metagenome]|uniref:Uncharacterized protein n=1 Tax=gut metagenome TaxID=749906 RepID=J9FAR8_9ZZZZ
MPLRISVIGPFLPKYLTRASFNASREPASANSASACSFKANNFSLIVASMSSS